MLQKKFLNASITILNRTLAIPGFAFEDYINLYVFVAIYLGKHFVKLVVLINIYPVYFNEVPNIFYSKFTHIHCYKIHSLL